MPAAPRPIRRVSKNGFGDQTVQAEAGQRAGEQTPSSGGHREAICRRPSGPW